MRSKWLNEWQSDSLSNFPAQMGKDGRCHQRQSKLKYLLCVFTSIIKKHIFLWLSFSCDILCFNCAMWVQKCGSWGASSRSWSGKGGKEIAFSEAKSMGFPKLNEAPKNSTWKIRFWESSLQETKSDAERSLHVKLCLLALYGHEFVTFHVGLKPWAKHQG